MKALASPLETIVPAHAWGLSHAEALAFARARSIRLSGHDVEAGGTWTNLWGRSIAADDSVAGTPNPIFTLTRAPEDCPDEPAYIEVDFEHGVPVRTNGVEMPLLEMVESLETIAGAHGVGRIERRSGGATPHAALEAPAAVVLAAAHRALQALVIPRQLERLVPPLARAFDDLVHDGRWFSPTCDAIAAFVSAIQPRVTGSVTVRLFKGTCGVVSRRSPHAPERIAHRGLKRLSAGR